MLKYWLWMAELPGLTNQARLAFLRHFGTPENAFYADAGEILLTEGVAREQAEALEEKSLAAAEKILEDCRRLGLRILTFQDAEYPNRLRNIYDPPFLLYVRGHLPPVDEEPVITVVGTRRCTPYGETCGEKLGYGLARGGAVVVSGLARGVDAAATRGALRGGGVPIGVLGCGLDVVYPPEHRYLYEDVAAAGALLSEYPPGTEPVGRNFPVRNRIMAGLSVGTVVVEARRRADYRQYGAGTGPGSLRRSRSHRRACQRGVQPHPAGRRHHCDGAPGRAGPLRRALPGQAAPGGLRRGAGGLGLSGPAGAGVGRPSYSLRDGQRDGGRLPSARAGGGLCPAGGGDGGGQAVHPAHRGV